MFVLFDSLNCKNYIVVKKLNLVILKILRKLFCILIKFLKPGEKIKLEKVKVKIISLPNEKGNFCLDLISNDQGIYQLAIL